MVNSVNSSTLLRAQQVPPAPAAKSPVTITQKPAPARATTAAAAAFKKPNIDLAQAAKSASPSTNLPRGSIVDTYA